jgi:hypothetical protein
MADDVTPLTDEEFEAMVESGELVPLEDHPAFTE